MKETEEIIFRIEHRKAKEYVIRMYVDNSKDSTLSFMTKKIKSYNHINVHCETKLLVVKSINHSIKT